MSSTRAITEYIAPSGDFLVNGVPPKKATIDYLESFEENFSLNNFVFIHKHIYIYTFIFSLI